MRFPRACRGTDGASAARKVQPGARPTEAALRTADAAGEGWEEAMGAATAGEGDVLRTPSGGVLRFAEQLEMERQEPRWGEWRVVGGRANTGSSRRRT